VCEKLKYFSKNKGKLMEMVDKRVNENNIAIIGDDHHFIYILFFYIMIHFPPFFPALLAPAFLPFPPFLAAGLLAFLPDCLGALVTA
jgi:hypothetical protein